MSYGPSTNRHIVKLASGEAFSSAAAWSPDDFTLPFAERLAENIAEYHDLPSGSDTSAILHIIQEGADRKGIRLARTVTRRQETISINFVLPLITITS